MLWIIVHLIALTVLLVLLKKRVLGPTGATVLRYVAVVYGALFDLYVSGAAFFLNPYNNKLYRDFVTQDWILMVLTNAGILTIGVTVLWLLIRYARRWGKRDALRSEETNAEKLPVSPSRL